MRADSEGAEILSWVASAYLRVLCGGGCLEEHQPQRATDVRRGGITMRADSEGAEILSWPPLRTSASSAVANCA